MFLEIVILENGFCRMYFSHIHLNTLNMKRLSNYGIGAVYTVCFYSEHTDAVYLQSYTSVAKLVSLFVVLCS